MKRFEVINLIKKAGIVPVVRTTSASDALFAVEAVVAAGIRVVEITLTVPGAVRVVREIAEKYQAEILVGAGTVFEQTAARECAEAGAHFVVSPVFNAEVVEFCRRNGIAILAGALTPTEIFAAHNAGADLIKIFPCGAVGGASYLKSIKAVFPDVDFVPTGGVSLATATDFLRAGAAALGVGSDLFGGEANSGGRRQKIINRAGQYLEIIRRANEGAAASV